MSVNKETAPKAMDELLNQRRDLTALDRHLTENCIQYNPAITDGRAGLRAIVPTLPDHFRYTML
ncbi:hypothetical protein ACFRMN_14485 [Streptomyces sp. NPDC056835]|uniref:hypothetical protein n=1 Tax=Streptomyces sp. NPDC056835 TaxID=3345956 RepID=UPI0036837C24